MPTWPVALPDKLPRRAQSSIVDGRAQFQPDAGPPLVARRFTAASQVLSFEMPMTRTQVDSLETFFVTTLKGGSLEFDWTNSIGSNGLQYFRFVDRPSYDWVGDKRIARISLRTRPGVRV